MAKIHFTVSARAGKLLGRENFSNPEGAIIELVKNSYDADANNCLVFFDIPTNKRKESAMYIIDNGEGMTENVIKELWMKIGTGSKEKNYISDGKRIKTGAKGIGRFALDRLGFTTDMWTLSKKAKNNIGYHWKMDWNQFDNSDKSIAEIKADLIPLKLNLRKHLRAIINDNNAIELIENIRFGCGTILKISNLKDDWFNDGINNVYKSLEALIPPKEFKIPFDVAFIHLQSPKNYGSVKTAFFNDYDYKVKAIFNSEKLSVDFEITRNELNLNKIKKSYENLFIGTKKPYDLQTLNDKKFKYSKSIDKILKWDLEKSNIKLLNEVGSFELSFYYLKYSVSKKEGYPYKLINTKERRSVLDKFGGVKIYRDSFRVRPYGDPANDWLRLGARVAQSPAGAGQRIGDWRVRPEQTAGMISISRKTNPFLKDKSDRGALQENDSFEVFKKIIVGLIHEFEYDRSKILNIFYKYFQIEKEIEKEIEINERAKELANEIIEERENLEKKINDIKNITNLSLKKIKDEEKKAYEDTFKKTFKKIEEEHKKTDNEEIVQVRALASLGLIVSSFSHELKEIRNNSTEIKSLSEKFKSLIIQDLKNTKEYNESLDILELLNENSKKIKHWINYSLTAIKKDKRTRKPLNFSKYFTKLEKAWKKVFKTQDIKFEITSNLKGLNYYFRAFEMDMDTIFTNLINNSIDSFNSRNDIQDRNICIMAKLFENTIEITYSDNGIGLSNVFEDNEEIYLPFVTTKKNGIGLGMYLVKNVIDDNNGSIEILDYNVGFSVKITFPTRRN